MSRASSARVFVVMRPQAAPRSFDAADALTRLHVLPARLTLVGVAGPLRGAVPGRDGGTLRIGRRRDSDICLPVAECSRRHARIQVRDGRYVIADLGTLNGTFVNERRIDHETALDDGDRIRIGEQIFEVRGAGLRGGRLREAEPDGGDHTAVLPVPRRRAPLAAAVAIAVTLAAIVSGAARVVAGARGPVTPAHADARTPPPAHADARTPTPATQPLLATDPPAAQPFVPLLATDPPAPLHDEPLIMIELAAPLAVRAPVDGTIERVLPRGAAVRAGDPVAELRRDAGAARRRLEALNGELEDAEDDESLAARARAAARELEIDPTALVRSSAAGVAMAPERREGERVRAGDVVAQVARAVLLHVERAALAGRGGHCRLRVDGATPAEVDADEGWNDDPERLVLRLRRVPAGASLAALMHAHIRCDAPAPAPDGDRAHLDRAP